MVGVLGVKIGNNVGFSPFDFFYEKISPLCSSIPFLFEKQAFKNPGVK